MTVLGQTFFLLYSCSFQSSLSQFSSQETPYQHKYPPLSTTVIYTLAFGYREVSWKPQQDHNHQHRSQHTKHTPASNSSLLTQLPLGMPQKKEFQPKSGFPPLPCLLGTAGQGQCSPSGLLDSVWLLQALPHCGITTLMLHKGVTRPRVVPKHVS